MAQMTVDMGALSRWIGSLQKPPAQLTVAELNAAATELKVPLPDLMQFVSMFAAGPAPGGGNQLAGGMAPGAVVPPPQANLYSNDPARELKDAAELITPKDLPHIEGAFCYLAELSPALAVRSSFAAGPQFDEARAGLKKSVIGFLNRRGYDIPDNVITVIPKGDIAPGAAAPVPQANLHPSGPLAQLHEAIELLKKSVKELPHVQDAFFFRSELAPAIGVRSSIDSGPAFDKARVGIKNAVVGFLERRGYAIREDLIAIVPRNVESPPV
jgi:hypothetical protein